MSLFLRVLPGALVVCGSVSRLALGAPGASPPARTSPASPAKTSPTAESVRRWIYRLDARSEAGAGIKGVELALVEVARRPHGDGEAIELTVERDGRTLAADELDKLGLGEQPPGPVFSIRPGLLVRILRNPGGSTVTLFDGAAADRAEALKEPLARWRLSDARKSAPRAERTPADRAYSYGRKVAEWPSVCQAYAHPSPETGDYYEWERCYAHGVGITRMVWRSAWGEYELDLVRPPAP